MAKERILSLRKKLKWSQDELAKRIGTSAPIVGRYERNEIKPSIEVAKKLADELGVTIDYLIGGTNKVFDKRLLKKIEEIESLSQQDRMKIYELIIIWLSGIIKQNRRFLVNKNCKW